MNKRLAIYAACILLLEWFCIINAYIIDLKGASVDATKFHEAAVQWLQFGSYQIVVDAQFYSQLLGTLYWLFGTHEFVGAQLSVLALAIGAVYFERVLNLFRVQNACYWVIPFTLWPSLLTRATTVMREPILLCLTVMIVYYLLQYRRDERQLNAVYAIALCLGAALIHKAYAVLVIFLVPYILFFLMKQKENFYQSGVFYSRIVLALAFGGLLLVVYKQLGNVRGLEPLLALMSGDTDYMQAVVDSKTGKAARATYAVSIDFSSVASILRSYPVVVVYYLFSPFPWRVGSVYDAYASLEGLARMASLACLYVVYKRNLVDRKNLQIVFLILASITLIWAAGTANYGTASRHHTTTIWFFLLFVALITRHENVLACYYQKGKAETCA